MSNSASSMVQSQLWTHFMFIIISAVLLVSLLYQYLLPWQHAGQIIKTHGRDPRPRVFYRFILFIVLSLFASSILNVVFLAQDVPSATPTSTDASQGASLHVQNLSMNAWVALMVLATLAQQLPYVLLFLTVLNVLQSRWYALMKAETGHKTVSSGNRSDEEYKLPAFLGWKGKEGTSFLIAFLLVLLPLSSRIVLAVGLGTFPNPMVVATGDFERFEQLEKAVMWLDGMQAATVFISVADIAVSCFCLSKRLRAAGYRDSITTSVLRIFTPFMAVYAVQIVVASALQTVGPPPSESTVAAVGLSTVVVGDVVVASLLICLSVLYAALPRWLLDARLEYSEGAYVLELPTLAKHSVRTEG